ncbi:hypothetical protein TSUD_190740 [Trifolium subterraneum]|uniref:Uncharacterized protein n=1 Tax=Trifolium subterraneum TaxID=3900 RepID=A0A2Z6PMM9_TRISU|nr:hypothetical protein TSUD_190740 [Trifolium subterraneum]
MASISHSFTTTTTNNNPSLNLPHNRSSLLRLSSHSFPRRFFNNVRIIAQHTNSTSTSIDFNDPDWKIKFQQDFESRFRLPHITDIFPDTPSIPSTFCLRMRTPIGKDIPGHYSLDEEWHGYINNNDRTINYSSPKSAGAECIDPNCTWVEQW